MTEPERANQQAETGQQAEPQPPRQGEAETELSDERLHDAAGGFVQQDVGI